jgi:glycolate oxidase iron-sulfur subunit
MSAPSFETLMATEHPKLLNCVHCGLCLDECPTYRLTGVEANSPRGRLALWRAEWEGRLEPSKEADFYTDECVGCLACVSACPANVPYGDLLLEQRAKLAGAGRAGHWQDRLAAALIKQPRLFQVLTFPLRLVRRLGLRVQRLLFPGNPALLQSTAAYARHVNAVLKPQGPTVSLLTGCLMEGGFREINAATVRVLAANGYQVSVPEEQTCCGAVHEHAGLHEDKAALDRLNQAAFAGSQVVITNSSGCGLSLKHAIGGKQRDLVDFLNTIELKQGMDPGLEHAYYDFPCHAYHGLNLRQAPGNLFKAAGMDGRWTLAPGADRCCGSGGSYFVTHKENSLGILDEKSSFLKDIPYSRPVLVTGNHVCMMQWSQVPGLTVKHAVQVLDESYAKAGYYKGL